MFSMSVSTCLRGGLAAAAVLVLPSTFNLPLAAQAAASATAADRAHIEDVLKGLNRGRSVGQVAVSPDGKRLAWLQPAKDGTEIRVAPLDELANSERVTAAAKPEQHCREGEIV